MSFQVICPGCGSKDESSDELVMEMFTAGTVMEFAYLTRSGLLIHQCRSDDGGLTFTKVLPFPAPPPAPSLSFFTPPVWLSVPPLPEPIPTETRADPIVTVKALGIRPTSKGLEFFGVYGRPYGPDEWAECNFADHIAPAEHCSCGFYAKDGTQLPKAGFLAHVELSGTVFEHGPGEWRARRQRIMSVTASRTCFADSCESDARCFVTSSRERYRGAGDQYVQVVPSCATHAPFGGGSVADLASRLGTEFAWEPERSFRLWSQSIDKPK